MTLASHQSMHSKPTDRRAFVATLAGGAAGLLSPGLSPRAIGAFEPPNATPAPKWDDSWTTRLGQHRTVFDIAELEAQPGLGQIPTVLNAFNDVLGTTDKDLGFVAVVRHFAMPMLFTDVIWEKYGASIDFKQKDPETKDTFKHNPFARMVRTIQQRGVVVLGCHSATMWYAETFAQPTKTDSREVHSELLANLLPGSTILPNGLYALARAQDVGCGFMR